MRLSEWYHVYDEILRDLNIDRSSDESSARMLKMLTLNSDLISDEELHPLISKEVIVVGGNVSDNDTELIKALRPGRTLISAGSATDVLIVNGIIPDITVTDLDGDVGLQKKASLSGSVMLIHAHGDNTGLIAEHVRDLRGKMMITTQSVPDHVLYNFGGFTDGDRAVCMARHFGAKKMILVGFEFDTPSRKPDTDTEMKKRKLRWAKKIIFDMNPDDVTITML
ncbi:MAG: DUF115 domain-containing protein [Methanomassiliicoccaceae archaeon]|jgi:uncharacterized Rossmann fold enzyme|nr:DUF115 domain-containing protein [Methanomassiliicoccaceae archaeon]